MVDEPLIDYFLMVVENHFAEYGDGSAYNLLLLANSSTRRIIHYVGTHPFPVLIANAMIRWETSLYII